jgi:hypothetical protein
MHAEIFNLMPQLLWVTTGASGTRRRLFMKHSATPIPHSALSRHQAPGSLLPQHLASAFRTAHSVVAAIRGYWHLKK